MRRMITLVLAALALLFALTACSGDTQSPPKKGAAAENATRAQTYDTLVASQPAHTMSYSPTRATKNFWIDTWNKQNKLSYVYLMNGQGTVFGYFVLVGLPVSYCVGLVPPTQVQGFGVGGQNGGAQYLQVQQPSVDGTYASASNCNEFYGKDATSGAYVEYSVGMGINALIFDQPMPQYGDAKPLAETKIK